MKYKCPKCGYVFTGEVSYCPNCGLKLKYHKDEKPEVKNDNQNNQNNANEVPNNTSFSTQATTNSKPTFAEIQPTPQPQPVQQNLPDPQPVPVSYNSQPTAQQNVQPEQKKKSNAHNVFAFICALIAAAFLVGALFLPILNCTIAGTDIPGVTCLEYYVYLFTVLFTGGVDFGNMLESVLPFVINATAPMLVVLFMAIAAILTLCAFIINLVRMIKRAPYSDSYRGNGITALMILILAFDFATFYVPGMLYVYLHELIDFNIIVTGINWLMFIPLIGVFGLYFPLRIVYRVFRNKAQ